MDGDFGVECFPSGRGKWGRVRWEEVRVSWEVLWGSGLELKPWEMAGNGFGGYGNRALHSYKVVLQV
ncbi:hypothetical protein Tco_0745158 [Tanacetum coccineum]